MSISQNFTVKTGLTTGNITSTVLEQAATVDATGNITGSYFVSTTTNSAPFVVNSNVLVANLYVARALSADVAGNLSLETNGNLNASQSVLNLVAGANITITNTANGNVVIAGQGGGAGGAVTFATNGVFNSSNSNLNLIAGNNITLTSSANGNVTISVSSVSGVPTAISQGPDWPPANPTAYDDEFTEGALAGKWTVVGNVSHVSVSGTYLSLRAQGTGGDYFDYIWETAPTPPYTITAKIAPTFYNSAYTYSGIIFGDSTGKVVMFQYNNGIAVAVNYWTNNTTFNSTPVGPYNLNLGGVVYFRVADDGTNLTFACSNDGVSFVSFGGAGISRTAFLTSGPTRIGVGSGLNQATSSNCTFGCDWFRRTS